MHTNDENDKHSVQFVRTVCFHSFRFPFNGSLLPPSAGGTSNFKFQLHFMDVIKISWEVCQSLETYKVVGSKKVQSTTCKYPSCHLNLEPKKFLQLFEFSSQAQVTANESEELPQSFFRSGDNVRSGLWCPVVSTRMHAIGLSQHGCMPSDWRCHMFKEMWNGSVTFPPSLLQGQGGWEKEFEMMSCEETSMHKL